MDERAEGIGKTTAMYIVAVIAVIAIVTGIVYTSMTVYDKETTETYTVTYYLNGGTGYCPEPVKVEEYEGLTVDLSDPPTRKDTCSKVGARTLRRPADTTRRARARRPS